jgi:hypothetical protein
MSFDQGNLFANCQRGGVFDETETVSFYALHRSLRVLSFDGIKTSVGRTIPSH